MLFQIDSTLCLLPLLKKVFYYHTIAFSSKYDVTRNKSQETLVKNQILILQVYLHQDEYDYCQVSIYKMQ